MPQYELIIAEIKEINKLHESYKVPIVFKHGCHTPDTISDPMRRWYGKQFLNTTDWMHIFLKLDS